ncbi:MAG: urate hydroxylase PuuD [Ginsengibacter sp.]
MLNTFTFFLLLLLLVMLTIRTYRFSSKKKVVVSGDGNVQGESEASLIKTNRMKDWLYTGIVLCSVGLLVCVYIFLKGSMYEPLMMEWLNIIVRLMHITFGIAWIGASFYFVFLENALNRTENVRDELAGNLWAVHGGGFYYLEKYKVAPKEIPKHLHWFKYEAYFTWLTGFSLLFVVYYFHAQTFLVDKSVMDLSSLAAISIGIGSLIVGWIIYDLLCKTPLVKKGVWFALIGFIIATAFAWFYTQVFSGRAAYIHFGAMLGTIMAFNVFFIIIPSQKAMVRAAKLGKPLDPELGKKAGLRSLHNNYFTMPVLFVMISNHFPSTFGNAQSWLVLAILSLGVAGVKHWLNLREKGQYNVWVLPVSVLIILAAAYLTAPVKKTTACKSEITFSQVNAIVQSRCIQCHSANPTDSIFIKAPNGVMYDTPDEIVKYKDKILQRAVLTESMPLANLTHMTKEEREVLRCWIEQGAKVGK